MICFLHRMSVLTFAFYFSYNYFLWGQFNFGCSFRILNSIQIASLVLGEMVHQCQMFEMSVCLWNHIKIPWTVFIYHRKMNLQFSYRPKLLKSTEIASAVRVFVENRFEIASLVLSEKWYTNVRCLMCDSVLKSRKDFAYCLFIAERWIYSLFCSSSLL